MTLLLSVSCTSKRPAVYMLRPHEELPKEISRDDNVRITCVYYGNMSANVFASVCTMTTSVFYRQGLDIVSSDCQ